MNKLLFALLIFMAMLSVNHVAQSEIKNKFISVTIDDLPFNRPAVSNDEMKMYVARLVDKIKKQNIPVVAFVNENKLETNGVLDDERVEILKLWSSAGVELGNHTFSHPSANKTSIEDYKKDILMGERVTKKILKQTGAKLRYFRHPFLHTGLSIEYREEVEKFLKEHGYTVAPVTIDNSEWIYSAAYDKAIEKKDEALVGKIGDEYIEYMKTKLRYFESQSQKLFDRQIKQVLLIHSNRLNSDYYINLCNMISAEGYNFINLEEALKDEAYKSPDTFIKNNGISWLHRWAFTRGMKRDFFVGEPEVPEHILKIAGIDSE